MKWHIRQVFLQVLRFSCHSFHQCCVLICHITWGVVLGPSDSRSSQPLKIHLVNIYTRYSNVWNHKHILFWRCGPTRSMDSSSTRILDYTRRLTTVCRTSLYEWSARRRDLQLTTHNTHKRETFIPPTGFETTTSAGKRPQNYALDRVATRTGNHKHINMINCPLAQIYFIIFILITCHDCESNLQTSCMKYVNCTGVEFFYFGIPRLPQMCKNKKKSWRTKAQAPSLKLHKIISEYYHINPGIS